MTDAERLKAYDDELSAEMPADLKDWWRNSRDEWPLVARLVLQNRRERLEECYAEIERLRRVELDRSRAELDNNDGLTLTAVRELLARKSTAELVGTLRDLAADYRFELMPAKFRCVMQEAANRLEK